MEPLTILAALAPLAVDLGKSLIGRFINTDGYKPANIGEWLQMRQTDLQLFQAINQAGAGQASYPWVEAIVRLQRPAVGAVALGVWAWSRTAGTPSPEVDNFAAVVGFYLFGDRTLFYARKVAPK